MQVTKGANKNRMSLTKMSAGQADRITDLELQLKEARAHNDYLKGANEIIAHQLAVYERRNEDMQLMEEELQFRRQQEKQMQEHLDNYHEINSKLRQQVVSLESKLKNKTSLQLQANTQNSFYERKHSEGDTQSIKNKGRSFGFLDQNITNTRRSLGGTSQKQNHPITPKTRVNLNINAYIQNDIKNLNGKKVFI